MKKKHLKILYISYDGAQEPIPQSQVLPYLKQFSANGVEVHWLSFDKKDFLDRKNERISFKESLNCDNIKWHSLAYHKKPTVAAKLYDMICGIAYASFLVFRNKIDIVHGRSEVASFIAFFLKKIFKTKFVYDRRGFMAEDYVEGGMWRSRNSLIYKLSIYVDKNLLHGADKVVVLTNRMRDILITRMPQLNNKVLVIPCCIDLQKFTPHKNVRLESELNISQKFTFLYLGSLGTWYMLDEMLDFFSLALTMVANAHFLILTQSDLDIARDKVKKHGLSLDDFTITGVSPQAVQEYIPVAKVSLIFIKPIFSKIASSPTKFGEALACGVPIIINYGIGDTEQIVRNERIGVVVKAFDKDAYKKALEELFTLLKEESTLKERCRMAAIKYFALSDGVEKYLQVYNAV